MLDCPPTRSSCACMHSWRLCSQGSPCSISTSPRHQTMCLSCIISECLTISQWGEHRREIETERESHVSKTCWLRTRELGLVFRSPCCKKPMFYSYTHGWEPAVRYSSSQGKGCSWHSCGQKAPKDLEKMGEKAGQGICDKPTVSAHGTSWDYRQRLGLGDSKESFGPHQGTLSLISFIGNPRVLS